MPATPTTVRGPDEFRTLLDNSVTSSESSHYIFVADKRLLTFAAFAGSGAASAVISVSLEDTPTNWIPLATINKDEVKQFSGVFAWVKVVKNANTQPLTVQLRTGLVNGVD